MGDILDLSTYQKKKLKKIRKRKEAKARKLGMGGGLVIQTLASKAKGASAPELVTFVDHKNRKKVKESDNNALVNLPTVQDNRKEITMKQARFEVFKLGVSAMDKKSQVDANTALALRLGAKPAKNEGIEYKTLKEDRSREKEELKLKMEEDKNALQGVKQKKGTREKGKSKTKTKKGSGQMKVGSFDGGMLKLSSKDLARLKAK